MPQCLTGSARPPLRPCILILVAGAHVQAADIALHLGGPPRVAALLPVIPRRGELQLRGKILRQTGDAALLQRVSVRLHPILGRCRGGEIPPAVPLLAIVGGGGRGDHVHDVHVLHVVLGLLAWLVGRLDHGDGGVVIHGRVGRLAVVGIGGSAARLARDSLRPLGNGLSRHSMLLLEKLPARAPVLLPRLRAIPRPPVVHVQIAQAGGTKHPLRLGGPSQVGAARRVGRALVNTLRTRRLASPVPCLLRRVLGTILGASARLELRREIGRGRLRAMIDAPTLRFLVRCLLLALRLLLARGPSLLRPLGPQLLRDAGWWLLLRSPQLLLESRGGRLGDDHGHVLLGPPRRLRLLVGEDGGSLVDRETRKAGGGGRGRPGARFRRSIVRRWWARRVRGWHLAEHFIAGTLSRSRAASHGSVYQSFCLAGLRAAQKRDDADTRRGRHSRRPPPAPSSPGISGIWFDRAWMALGRRGITFNKNF